MKAWHREVVELHEFFEGYFLGSIDADDVSRLESALAPDFTIVGPSGCESSRDATIAAIRAGHGTVSGLSISIIDTRVVAESTATMIARYVEVHESAELTNRRLSTVVFAR